MKAKRGNPRIDEVRNTDTNAANQRRKSLADQHASEMAKAIHEAMHAGVTMPYDRYAEWLNDKGYRTRRGNLWTGRTVSRLFKKITDPAFAATIKATLG